jgi:hypothetical protein
LRSFLPLVGVSQQDSLGHDLDFLPHDPDLNTRMALCQSGENVLFDCLSTSRSLFLCFFPRTFRSHSWTGSWAMRLLVVVP